MSQDERLDLDQIRALIRLATESEIAELEVDLPHMKVRIKKAGAAAPGAHVSNPGPAAPPRTQDPAAAARGSGYVPIVAPMVGTFFRSVKPDAPPFVAEGDAVQVGQTVCILEAMKLFNEIPSEVAGRIVQILADNGAPVEYGQPLFLVDPAPAS